MLTPQHFTPSTAYFTQTIPASNALNYCSYPLTPANCVHTTDNIYAHAPTNHAHAPTYNLKRPQTNPCLTPSMYIPTMYMHVQTSSNHVHTSQPTTQPTPPHHHQYNHTLRVHKPLRARRTLPRMQVRKIDQRITGGDDGP